MAREKRHTGIEVTQRWEVQKKEKSGMYKRVKSEALDHEVIPPAPTLDHASATVAYIFSLFPSFSLMQTRIVYLYISSDSILFSGTLVPSISLMELGSRPRTTTTL